MTSEREIAANRRNAHKSTGPRTGRGKARAARNALRHGLAGIGFDPGLPSNKGARIARLVAGTASDGARYEQAIIIAESSLLILRIRAFRVKAIERFRERLPSRFFPGFPLPQEVAGIGRQIGLGNSRAVRDLVERMYRAMVAGNKELRAGLDELRGGDVSRLIAIGEGVDTGAPTSRTDAECFLLALSEIRALERYERRALSRRRRAVRIFDALSSARP